MKTALWLTALALTIPALAPAQTVSPADRAFFEAKVRPLLVQRCHECHSTKAAKKRGGLKLDSQSAILRGGDSGAAVVAGEPKDSLLIKAVRYGEPYLQMPPRGKLPAREIAILEEWVRRGAHFPGSEGGQLRQKTVDLVEGRKHWAFLPLRQGAPPAVKNSDWVRQPLDAFILAKLEAKARAPAARAEPRTLIRRLYFDLIGLPPAPEEVEAFLQDQAPNALEKLVDRLLASPQHGERWARFWLDLVRYCDVPEPWAECKGQSHLYRDWVVQALNDDLPYDQFVVKQLAADLVPNASPSDRAALGFLGLSPSYWKELKLDKDVIRGVVAEEWEERIGTLTGTFLGLTVACARCHDHKFDPISAHDYYALAGVLASSRPIDRLLLPDAQAKGVLEAQAKVKSLEAEIVKLKAKKPAPPEVNQQLEKLTAQIADIRQQTPNLDARLVPSLDEASLLVEADGPHKTKLVWKPGVAQDVALQVRGNPSNLGPVVPRRFLAVLSPEPAPSFKNGSGRLELAQAIVRDAAPLTARVIVNRTWKQHFGAGLVETPSDFGTQGERPSHPELLDDLAARFIKSGWSLKWLHREIVLSATYRQASLSGAEQVDPGNRLLGRMNRRRLDVEMWRDAMLAVTGRLERTLGGPPLDLGDAKNNRRTLYGLVKRRELHDLLRLHDFPNPTTHSPNRLPTTTPLQQLFVLNSPFVQEMSRALAQRLQREGKDDAAHIRRVYLLLYGRPATEGQVRLGVEFLNAGGAGAWEQYAQVLLGSNEFLFVD